MVSVILVDDHKSFRQSLAFMMDLEPDLSIVGQAGSLAEARRLTTDVNVAVVDLNLPDGNGADFVKELRAATPNVSVLILSASVDRLDFARAVEAGAEGILNKSAGVDEIIEGVRRLSRGEILLPLAEVIELLRLVDEHRQVSRGADEVITRLTIREREVLQCLADGLTDKEIADRLSISNDTVRKHMVNLLAKLNAESRLQALILAVRLGIVSIK